MRGRGWTLVSATADRRTRLPFCTGNSISVPTHPSCEVGTWLGSLETFEGTCRLRVNELGEAYTSNVAQEFIPLGVGC